MVKKKTQAPPAGGGDEYEEEITEDTDDYHTGPNDTTEEEGHTEVSDSEMEAADVTVVHKSRQFSPIGPSSSGGLQKTAASNGLRRSSRLLKKRQTGSGKQIEENLAQEPDPEAHSEPSGIYNTIKMAIQDMTTQVVSAIQAAFRGNAMVQAPSEDATGVQKTSKPQKKSTRQARSTTSVKSKRGSQPSDPESSDSSSDESGSESDDSDVSVATSKITQSTKRSKFAHNIKLPAFTGKEKWEVWFNRFEAVANLKSWDEPDRLQELLPRLQGEAGDFAFDQLSKKTLRNYNRLIKELGNRFGVIETSRTYKLQFSRRKQLTGETPEKFAAELKRLYDKAYKKRDAKTRQEDLLQRFLLGLQDFKARIHIELNKDPETIEEAVHEVITYTETMKNPNQCDDNNKKAVRQVKKTEKDNQHGQLNGRKQAELVKKEDSKTSIQRPDADKMLTIKEADLQKLFNKMFEDKQQELQSKAFSRPNMSPSTKPVHNNQNNGSHNTLLCFRCGRPGHFARNCFESNDRSADRNLYQQFQPRQPWGQKTSFNPDPTRGVHQPQDVKLN